MVGVTSVNLGGIEVDVEDVADRLRRLKEREVTPSSVGSPTPSEGYSSPYVGGEETPGANSSPLAARERPSIVRSSTPRRDTRSVKEETNTTDGDAKLKNFFQSLLVNKGK